MNQKLRSMLNWRPGGRTAAESVWQSPGDDPDIGYEAATPYLSSQPGSLDELPALRGADVPGTPEAAHR